MTEVKTEKVLATVEAEITHCGEYCSFECKYLLIHWHQRECLLFTRMEYYEDILFITRCTECIETTDKENINDR